MNTQNTDLIVRSSKYEGISAGTSVFGRFLSALVIASGAPKRISLEAEITGFPVLEAVSAGLAILCKKLAEKFGVSIATESMWQNLADRVHRMVSIGMLLEYKTPEAAAEAFLKSLGGKIPSEQQGLSQFFFQPSASFFAVLFSATTRARGELEKLVERNQELLNVHSKIALLNEAGFAYYGSVLLPWLDANKEGKLDHVLFYGFQNREVERIVEQFYELLEELPREYDLILALRALPVNFKKIEKSFGASEHFTIEGVWVRTQLLLLAIDAPVTDQVLHADDYPKAQANLMKLSEEEATEGFLQRMFAMGMNPLSATQLKELCSSIGEQFRSQVLQKVELLGEILIRPLIDFHTSRGVHYSHEKAVEVLIEGYHGAMETIPESQLLVAVDWQQLKWATIDRMIRESQFPRLVLSGIGLMPEKLQERAYKFAFSCWSDEKLRMQIIELCPKLLLTVVNTLQYGAEVAVGFLESQLSELFALFDTHKVHDRQQAQFAELLCERIPAKLNGLISDPATRHATYRVICYNGSYHLKNSTSRLKACFTPVDWEKMTLAWFVINASPLEVGLGTYSSLDPDNYKEFAPWEERFVQEDDFLASYVEMFGYTQAELRALVERYSEEQIFRWVYEGLGAELESGWQTYAVAREEFYVRRSEFLNEKLTT